MMIKGTQMLPVEGIPEYRIKDSTYLFINIMMKPFDKKKEVTTIFSKLVVKLTPGEAW